MIDYDNCVELASGYRWYFNRVNRRLTVEDIAPSLSRICRFNGNIPLHYSVAQHSVLMAMFILDTVGNVSIARQALLHDAHEVITGDMTSPWQREICSRAPDGGAFFRDTILQIEAAVRNHLGVPAELDPLVKAADGWFAWYEGSHFLPSRAAVGWKTPKVPAHALSWLDEKHKGIGWSAEVACTRFVRLYHELTPVDASGNTTSGVDATCYIFQNRGTFNE